MAVILPLAKNQLHDTTEHNCIAIHYIYQFLVLTILLFTPTTLANTPTIHLVTEHLPPYQIIGNNKKLSGFSVDIIKETMARSRYNYTLKAYPWVRSYKLAQINTNHCIFSIARLKSREQLFKWVGPISKFNNAGMWSRKDTNIEINNLDDAKQYNIAVNRDDIAHTGLLERGFIEGKHLYVLDDSSSLITLLVTRPEIDLIVADDSTIGFRAELASVDVKSLQKVYEVRDLPLDFYFACSRDTDNEIVEHLSTTLNSIYLDGSYKAILQKWKSKMINVD